MENKKKIGVELKVREIVYDIMNKTHLTGKSREAEGKKNYEAASHMQASEDNESSYQIRRSISNAFAELKVHMGEYLDENRNVTTNLVNQAVDNIDVTTDAEFVAAFRKAVEEVESSDTAVATLKTAANATNATKASVETAYNTAMGSIADEETRMAVENAWNTAKAQLTLWFLMPSNFNKASIDSLGGGCHQYITGKAIADWFTITNPEEAQTYLTLAEAALVSAKQALYKRSRPERPEY